jgi:hypothetical protein
MSILVGSQTWENETFFFINLTVEEKQISQRRTNKQTEAQRNNRLLN